MSWQATAHVAEITENITRSEKLLLLCLANRHNIDTGRIFPSIERLARESLMSTRTCIRCLHGLEAKGFIQVKREQGMVNHYVIVGLGTSDKMAQVQNGTRDKWDGTSDISSATSDIAMSPDPKEEPKEKPKYIEREKETLTSRILREKQERRLKRRVS